ncbi:hypothetical protein [Chromobacterium sp. Beijing]|uniref:hypothetical protein n=1 Tax=Chromobacterium sp. Beijing TaxID=2735795 RepID=UPI001F30ABCB|nr:hypothetical protein [Chromobacterium sp. Beijing]
MEVVRKAWPLLLLCIGANTIGIAGVYFTNTFMIVFTTEYLGLANPRFWPVCSTSPSFNSPSSRWPPGWAKDSAPPAS